MTILRELHLEVNNTILFIEQICSALYNYEIGTTYVDMNAIIYLFFFYQKE